MQRKQLTPQQLEERSRRFLASRKNKLSGLSPKMKKQVPQHKQSTPQQQDERRNKLSNSSQDMKQKQQRGRWSRSSSEQSVKSYSEQRDLGPSEPYAWRHVCEYVPGWEEYYDPHAETYYYLNQKTGQANWQCPIQQQKTRSKSKQKTSRRKQDDVAFIIPTY